MKTLLPLLAICFALPANFAAAQGIPEVKPALVHGFSTEISDFRNGVTAGPGSFFYGVSEHGGRFGFGTFFECNSDGLPTVMVNFGEPDSESRGRGPIGQLAYDGGTFFYGVTGEGGRFGFGTIFRTTAAGAIETLVDFSGKDGAAPGFEPSSGLTLAMDGNFYGRLDSGPSDRGPGIFRMSPDGRYQFIVELPGDEDSHSFTIDPLLARPDGSLIGVTREGGTEGHGMIFRLNADGTITTLATFIGDEGVNPGAIVGEGRAPRGTSARGDRINGANPSGQPIAAADGTLYGIGQSRNGVQFGSSGFIWKIDPAGEASILVTLGFGGPMEPRAPMVFAPNNDLFVTCAIGGNSDRGGVFRFTPGGLSSVVSNFQGSGETVNGFAQFGIVDQGSGLYLTATDDEIVRVPIPGLVDVITFSSPDKNTNLGAQPNSPVAFTTATTVNVQTRIGGANRHGTIVKRPPAGPTTALTSLPADFFGSDEEYLTLDVSNNILIVDQFGGDNFNGRILQISPAGNLSTLASFPEDLLRPAKGLAPDLSGNTFFGLCSMLTEGGTGPDALAAFTLSGGTINRINPNPGLPAIGTSSDSFAGPLIPFGDGSHYLGVLEGPGPGRIFKLGMGGNVSTFHNFSGSSSGSVNPIAPLLREPGGSFLVAATAGDDVSIVRLSSTGKATRLARISNRHASEHLLAPLAQDTQGRIYGVLESGGAFGSGLLYRIDTDGTSRILYEFPVDMELDNAGANPSAGLTFNPTESAIYGVTEAGGPNGGGTIFKVFTIPNGNGSTLAATNVQPNSATLNASVTDNNGYPVEYWFTLSTDAPNSLFETQHVFTGGFHGTKPLSLNITGLRGHTSYYVELHAKVGFGADTIEITGSQIIVDTPNGAPNALDDTIIVTSLTEDAPGDVLANDLEAELDGDDLTIVSIDDPPDFGTVMIATDNKSVVYTPGPNFTATTRDSFTYTVSDNYNFAGGPLTSTATVNVLTDIAIAGEYAGLLFDDAGASASQPEGALVPSPDQIAAVFAQMALSKGRKFTARFGIGGRNVAVKGTMAANRGTRIASGRNFAGTLRTTPAGLEARITFNGRTLVMRAGQAFAAVNGPATQASDFTMRFDPTEIADPTSSGGLPAGSGFAVVRQGKTARATIAGALPDGTAFSAKSVIDPDGKMPFQARLNKGKAGTFDAELIVDIGAGTISPAPGTSARWEKPAQAKSKRFPGAFGTKLIPFGGKHTVPAKNTPPIDLAGGQLVATFDRGGLFAPLFSSFIFEGAKAVIAPGSNNTANAKAVINGKTSLVTGTFKPTSKAVKYRGVLIQRDKTVSGFFLGTVDAGSVEMVVEM